MIIELAFLSLGAADITLQRDYGYGYETAAERRERASRDGFVRGVRQEIDACTDDVCRLQKESALREALTLRDKAHSYRLSSFLAGNLVARCDLMKGGILVIRDCMKSRVSLTDNQKRSAVGLRRSGISWRGYNQLRTGMNADDVEFVLGDYGEQSSYSSSGGYSAEIRKYGTGGVLIVVSFSDGEISGYSQYGLRR